MFKSSLVLKLGLILSVCTPFFSNTIFAARKNQKSIEKYSFNKTFRTGLITYLSLFSKLHSAYSAEQKDFKSDLPKLIIRPRTSITKQNLRGNSEVGDRSEDIVHQKIADWALDHTKNIESQVEREMANSFQLVKISGTEDEKTVNELAQKLESDPDIDTVIVDFPVKPYGDPLLSKQWFLDTNAGVGATSLWKNDLEGEGVTIAVIDTGLASHEELDDRVIGGYDFITSTFTATDGDGRDADYTDPGDGNEAGECGADSGPSNDSWHGTHVAGAALASNGNNKGGSGVAPKANLLVLRALGKCGGKFSDIFDAMLWAVGESVPGVPDNENPADIINLSLGGSSSCTSGIDNFFGEIKKKAIIVAAAGNDGQSLDDSPQVPASCSNVFTVAATGPKKALAPYSNTGSNVDAAAAGGDFSLGNSAGILAPVGGNGGDDYAYYQGTSMASGVVSGAFALLKNFRNESGISTDEYMAQMRNATRQIDGCSECGFGRIDLTLLSKNFTSAAYSRGNIYLFLSAGIASGLTFLLI